MAALFASAGVIRVETVAQMFDVGTLLAHQPLPAGRAGGDRRQLHGHRRAGRRRRPRPGAGAGPRGTGRHRRRRHARGLPRRAAGGRRRRRRGRRRRGLPPAAHGRLEGVRAGAARGGAGARRSRSWRASCPPRASRPSSPSSTRTACRPGARCPSYSTPERAVIALAKVAEYARWRRRPVGELPELPDVDEDGRRARSCARVLADAPAGRELTDDELIALLAAYGVPLLGTRTVTDADAAVAAAEEVGYPVVLKSTAPWLRHRSDLGGVRLDLADADAVRAAFARDPVRRPGDRAGDGRARRGDGRRDRRRPVVRRAGQLRARGSGDRPARRPRLPDAAAHRPRRRRAGRGRRGPGRCSTATAAPSRSTSRRWRTCCCGWPGWPTTCPRCCG